MSQVTMAAVALSLLVLAPTPAQQSTNPPPEALDGVDVVVLLQQGKEVFGKSAFHVVHGGFEYLFSSAENKATFEASPEKYAIQLGGMCARMGGTVTGNPSDYFVHEGKIYIFGSDECRKLFIATPAKYLPRAGAPMPASNAAVSKGRQLLDRAAAAHGGAKLDGMATYIETWTTTQQRQTGPVSITNRNLWRFPGGGRNERTLPLAGGPRTIATVLTPAGAWGAFGSDVSVPPPGALPAFQRMLWQPLVALLRMRNEPDVKVAALGATTVNATNLERVRVVRGGVDITLLIDPASGRVHSTQYFDRKSDGEYGEIALAYGDYRSVEGVLVPFVEKGTFNGMPHPGLTRTLESASVNGAVDAALFTAPAQVAK
jgi:YHS domain-containing protein